MEHYLTIRMNDKLFLRNPEESELGRKIIHFSILLIHEIGFEAFTFRKLAQASGTTEASVYRYFENKHRLLLYLVDWYWSWQEYRLVFHTQNLPTHEKKVRKAIELMAARVDDDASTPHIPEPMLHDIVIREGAKAWLTRHVEKDNRDQLFKPYKDLCARIASFITSYAPDYAYPHSLATTIIEMAHSQNYYAQHLPALTDFEEGDKPAQVIRFIEDFVFAALGCGRREDEDMLAVQAAVKG